MNSIKLVIAYHTNTILPKNDIFLPFNLNKIPIKVNNIDELDSDIYNHNLYSELSAIYWSWKNLDYKYIGLCHYRRIPILDRIPLTKLCIKYYHYYKCKIFNFLFENYSNYVLSPAIFTRISQKTELYINFFEKKINQEFYKYDGFCLKKSILSNGTIYNLYEQVLSKEIMDLLYTVIKINYPSFLIYYNNLLSGNKLYARNIYIFKRDIFDNYCKFLFDVTFKLNNSINSLRLKHPNRVFGYTGELLLSIYIDFLYSNKFRIKEMNYLHLVDL
jgi:hypothetical protein